MQSHRPPGPPRPPRPPRPPVAPRAPQASSHAPRPPVGDAGNAGDARAPSPRRPSDEVRIYGVNACLALFARRPHDVRKVYLTEARLGVLKPVLTWCVEHRLGYRIVANDDLDRLTQSQHHEGVCFEVRRQPLPSLSTLLQRLPRPPKPALLVWLDGVGNPHNLGAVLRSAANFGVAGVILPRDSAPALSGAALRVAEGGAEAVPIGQTVPGEDVFGALRNAEIAVAATVPRAGESLYGSRLPARIAFVLGAEGGGLSQGLIDRSNLHLTIPGSGAVESLNVAASAAVLFGEYWRQHVAGGGRNPRR